MKEVVLFGIGKKAELVFEAITKAGCHVKAAICNDSKRQGTDFHGIPVIGIDTYLEKFSSMEILIGSTVYAKEMESQLKERGISNFSVPAELFEVNDVAKDNDIAHDHWPLYLKENFDIKGKKVLEVGSRLLSDNFAKFFEHANYTGFDYCAGENVDVVGDAHKLSSYFDHKFDLIFSSAVFEHLAMPWKVSLEMIKLLNMGGYIFIETHYSFSSHERPWHFFQFSENALQVLFPEKFGIECVKKSVSNLLRAEVSSHAAEYLQGRLVGGMYIHSEFLGRKVKDVPNEMIDWNNIDLEEAVLGSVYPAKKRTENKQNTLSWMV